jgi:glycolate oxidase iron-sulfur subunit
MSHQISGAGGEGAEGAEGRRRVSGLAGQGDALLACIHCGFCLPACPTYRVLGDEADSPRGRLHLMRAVGEGRLPASDPSFRLHLDRCLGCRACEPVCPAGVEYGMLLEHAREDIRSDRDQSLLTTAVVAIFGNRILNRIAGFWGRVLRDSGVAGVLARILPASGPFFPARKGLAMLVASRPRPLPATGAPAAVPSPAPAAAVSSPAPAASASATASPAPAAGSPDGARFDATTGSSQVEAPPNRGRVALLRGCVQQGLYARVREASERVLRRNGWEVVPMRDAGCCGALHAHAGDLRAARERARDQIRAFEASGADFMVSDAAGCGAAMRGYGHLLADDPVWADRALALEGRVRDVLELLAEHPVVPGGPVPLRATYDPPCHLLHAQRVRGAVERVMRAIPGLELVPLEGADGCCGGAGVYGLTHPELGETIGSAKARAIRETGAQVVLTGNPGCMMQIGSGLRDMGAETTVLHPVELLAESYRRRP